MSLSIEKGFNEEEKIWEFKVAGEVDISNADQLRDELNHAYTKNSTNIKIDLTNLSYLDSTGLGVLIGMYGKVRKDGNTVTLLKPRENVKKLLRITNLDKVLL